MTTYARLVDGFAVDCQVAANTAELSARFHPDWYAAHPFSVVPDGTLHGAKDNGNGTFTNPPSPAPSGPSYKDKLSAGESDWKGSSRSAASELIKNGNYSEATALLLIIGE